MRNSRDSRRTYHACAATWVVAALLVVAAPAAAVDPAVTEYSLSFPNAKGKSHPGADTPTARPSELGPLVRLALSDSARRDGKALAAIATAPELGASEVASVRAGNDSAEVASGETPSVPTALSRAVDDAPVLLGLLALLGVLGFLGLLARTRPTGNDS